MGTKRDNPFVCWWALFMGFLAQPKLAEFRVGDVCMGEGQRSEGGFSALHVPSPIEKTPALRHQNEVSTSHPQRINIGVGKAASSMKYSDKRYLNQIRKSLTSCFLSPKGTCSSAVVSLRGCKCYICNKVRCNFKPGTSLEPVI